MKADVVIVGGGLAGSTTAAILAKRGHDVVVLERETKFRDRVRGENMLPWGVAAARRLGVLDLLIAHGGHRVPWFNMYAMGEMTTHRPLDQTTPGGDTSLNMFHPDLQEALFAEAEKAGASMRRSATVAALESQNDHWRVSISEGDRTRSVEARVVVGADGKFSAMRKWGGFEVRRDPDHLRIAGALVAGTSVPDDGTHLCMGPGFATFVAPLGKQRARMYFIYAGAMGDRQLSGRHKTSEFLDACRATGAPAEWYEGAEVIGPLAEFEGADQSVRSPATRGLALIGDAAAATDPSWGCGLSKTLVDVEAFVRARDESRDWSEALERYAAAHDDHYGKLHNILSWMTELVWSAGPEAEERRARVLPKMAADPRGYPDPAGLGPFGPSDEQAKRLILGED
jgi:2-polyprenyl-6-methoxyphenol hydroxylase-like FAD-dependent oxidoreductase